MFCFQRGCLPPSVSSSPLRTEPSSHSRWHAPSFPMPSGLALGTLLLPSSAGVPGGFILPWDSSPSHPNLTAADHQARTSSQSPPCSLLPSSWLWGPTAQESSQPQGGPFHVSDPRVAAHRRGGIGSGVCSSPSLGPFGPSIHQLWSRAYAFLLLPSHIVLVRQGVRGNNAAPSACTPLGLGAYLGH